MPLKKKARTAASARRPGARYERQLPDARRRVLVEATIASLKRDGHEGLSIRRISAQAGVSLGLINHYFPNKHALIAEAYRHFDRVLVEGFRSAVERAPGEPRARLRAFFATAFSPPSLDQDVLAAWVVFWGLSRHSPEIRQAHHDTRGGYGDLLGGLLTALAKAPGGTGVDVRLATIGLTALLDGLWLEWCLAPDSFRPQEAVALCDAWIDGLMSGVLPKRASGARKTRLL